MAHRAACDGLTQPFEQAFKTRQALADLRLALLHGSDAEKPAELDGHQHVVRDFPRPEAEIEEQRRQAAQYEDRDATTGRGPRTGGYVNYDPRARRLSSSIRTTRLGRLAPHFQRTRLISSSPAATAKLRTSIPV